MVVVVAMIRICGCGDNGDGCEGKNGILVWRKTSVIWILFVLSIAVYGLDNASCKMPFDITLLYVNVMLLFKVVVCYVLST